MLVQNRIQIFTLLGPSLLLRLENGVLAPCLLRNTTCSLRSRSVIKP